MSFDLEAHLKHHAFQFKKLATISSNSIHFNFSFLDLQFLDKNVEDTMSKLLNALLLPTEYRVANGKRKDKHSNMVQKFTRRKVDLVKDVQAMAIHLKGPEGEDTMPHIHFIANGSSRFGNGYSLLKKHVSVVSEQFGLLPNFDEMVEHNPLSVKSLSCAVSQITWSWKKSTNAQLKSEISSRGLDKSISLLKSYCLKTKNLTYYVKSMEGLKTRLNRMKLDIVYEGHHLQDTYPIPLRDEDMEVIKLIQDKIFTQKAMKPYLKNPILRDFIRHAAKTSKPYIYDALKEQTNLLDNVSKNQQAVTSYKKLMQKETPIRKSQLTPKDNQNLSRKNELRRIIIEVSKSATNERTFKTFMQTAGYIDFGLKKKQGKVLGCIYKELESKRTVNFTELGLHWGELKKSFILNSRKVENAETLPSPTLSKKAPTSKETITSQKRTKTPKATNITYKSTSIKQKKNKKKDISLMRRKYEKLIRAAEDKIEQLEHNISKLRKGISKFKEAITRTGSRVIEIGKQITENFSSKEEYNALESDKSTLSREIETEEGYESSTKESIGVIRADINTEEDAHEKFRDGVISKSIRTRLTKDIGDRKSINQNLRGEISSLERKIAKNTESDNIYSPPSSGMRM